MQKYFAVKDVLKARVVFACREKRPSSISHFRSQSKGRESNKECMHKAKPQIQEMVENDVELETEGRYIELERRLWTGGKANRAKKNFSSENEFQQGDNSRRDADEGNYEIQGTGIIQSSNRSHIVQRDQMDEPQSVGDPGGTVHGGATDWQDYEDYEPGYSGHQQTSEQGRLLSGKDFKSAGGRPAIKKITPRARDWQGRRKKVRGLRRKGRNR
jgi:hypothetical protein